MTDLPLAPVNMHIHTHFSFNAEDRSPAELVDEAARRGLYAVATCDFDVLDGLDELYTAADRALLRAAAGIETRTYLAEYADKVMNSPGEPGVYYLMAMGFGSVPGSETSAGRMFAELRRRARERNLFVTGRISEAFPEMAIDYEADVIPLTPAGNATERHMVRAYIAKARDSANESDLWQRVLGVDSQKSAALMADPVALQNTVRSTLMKSGGVAYVQPDSTTFPPIDDVIKMALDAGAIPMATWLDGLNDGERDMRTQLECMRAKGCAALNAVPDRNWNIADPELRRVKIRNLHEVVRIAEEMALPMNVGTELNSFGLPFVDDFEAEPMRPLWPAFFRGANVMIGQTRLARFAGFSYCGEDARAEFGDDTPAKNDFFMRVGMLPCPDARTIVQLTEMGNNRCHSAIRDSVKADEWRV